MEFKLDLETDNEKFRETFRESMRRNSAPQSPASPQIRSLTPDEVDEAQFTETRRKFTIGAETCKHQVEQGIDESVNSSDVKR